MLVTSLHSLSDLSHIHSVAMPTRYPRRNRSQNTSNPSISNTNTTRTSDADDDDDNDDTVIDHTNAFELSPTPPCTTSESDFALITTQEADPNKMDTSEDDVVSEQPARPARPYLSNFSMRNQWRSMHSTAATGSGSGAPAGSTSQTQQPQSEDSSPISAAPTEVSLPPRSDLSMDGYTASSERSESKSKSTQDSSSQGSASPRLRQGLHDSKKGWKCCECGELNAPFFAECLRGMSQACGHTKCNDCARTVWQ